MPFYIQPYLNRQELSRAHPESRNFRCIFQKPCGMSDETAIRTSVLRALERQNLLPQPVYQVGDFFWISEHAMPSVSVPARCCCLQYIGDNPHCPVPGHRR